MRLAYGESTSDLSEAIECGDSAIRNYESGQMPKSEIRKKIAAHYRITEEQLMYQDLSTFTIPDKILDEEFFKNYGINIAPIFHSQIAKQNEIFCEAYHLHLGFMRALKGEEIFQELDLERCFEKYEKAYNEFDIVDALANMLGIIFLLDMIQSNEKIAEKMSKMKYKETTMRDLMKHIYLKSNKDDKQDANVEDFEIHYTEIFCELRKHKEYIDLIEYYIAMRYLLGCVRNDMSTEYNRVIGEEMMMAFALSGNLYALNKLQNDKKIWEN